MDAAKAEWSDADYDDMGWHDCQIYAIGLPGVDQELVLDIDYIFDWKDFGSRSNFLVAPCHLIFHDVLHLRIALDYQDSVGLDIIDVDRHKLRLSKNRLTTIWGFTIETSKGKIQLESTGYTQRVLKEPVWTESQSLQR